MKRKPKTLTLRQYFEDVVRLAMIANGTLKPKSIVAYRCCLMKFIEFVGYEIPVRKVDSDLLDRFLARLVSNGTRPKVARNYCWVIKNIVRYNDPDALPAKRNAFQPFAQLPAGEPTSAETVAVYLEQQFGPRVLSNASQRSMEKYRCVVRRADDFLKRPLLIEDLSDRLISEFSQWLRGQQMSEDRAQVYRQCLRAIAADAQQHGLKTGWLSSIDPESKVRSRGNRRNKLGSDHRGPKARTRRQIAKAATLFASGHSIVEIAEGLDVEPDAIRSWRKRHRSLWEAAYQSAVSVVVEVTRNEAARRATKIRTIAHVSKARAAEAHLRKSGQTMVADDDTCIEHKRASELIAEMASERGWTEGTTYQYLAALKGVETWSGRVLYVSDFAIRWVNEYLHEVECSVAPATARGRRVYLLSLWREAFEAGLCTEAPRSRKVRRIVPDHRPPEAWSVDEVNSLVVRAGTLTGCYGSGRDRVPQSLFWRLAIRLLWDTGLRIGDALQLKRSGVDAEGIVLLTQSKVGRWHVCRLHPSTLALLHEMAPRGVVLPWKASREFMSREFRTRIVAPLCLKGPLKKLRKSSASDVELHFPGMGSVHLGHRRGVDIAHNHYLDPRIVARNRPMPTELTADVG